MTAVILVLALAVWVLVAVVACVTFGGGAALRDREEGPR